MIIVYSTPECHRCKALKEALEFIGVPFEERDATTPEAVAEFMMHNIFSMAVPIVYDGERYYETNDLMVFDRGTEIPNPKIIMALVKKA